MIPKREFNAAALECLEDIPRGLTIRELTAAYLFLALLRNKNNRTHTAKELGIPRRSLTNKLTELSGEGYPIPEPRFLSHFARNLKANQKKKIRVKKLNDF